MQGHHAVPRQQKSPATPPQKACLHLTRCRTPRPRPPRGGAAPRALCSSSLTTDSHLQLYYRLTPLVSQQTHCSRFKSDLLLQSHYRLTPPVSQQSHSSSLTTDWLLQSYNRLTPPVLQETHSSSPTTGSLLLDSPAETPSSRF